MYSWKITYCVVEETKSLVDYVWIIERKHIVVEVPKVENYEQWTKRCKYTGCQNSLAIEIKHVVEGLLLLLTNYFIGLANKRVSLDFIDYSIIESSFFFYCTPLIFFLMRIRNSRGVALLRLKHPSFNPGSQIVCG